MGRLLCLALVVSALATGCVEVVPGTKCEGVTCARGELCSKLSKRCVTRKEARAEQREASARRDAKMLEASRRIPPSPSGGEASRTPGTRRLAETEGEWTALAACRDDERLITGGCVSQANAIRGSFPSEIGPDGRGGRWNCHAGDLAVHANARDRSNPTVRAIALCEVVAQ